MNQRMLLTIGIVVVILLAAGAFWYVRQRAYREGTTTSAPPSPGPQITEPEEKAASYDVVAYTTSSVATEIFSTSLQDGKRRIIFTDQDESLKVRALRHVFDEGRKVLAYLAPKSEQHGRTLAEIALEGSGKVTTLLDNFGASEAPIGSPDGKRVAYVVFSNADPDYGYSLMIMNSDGSNKRRLFRRETLLYEPAFKPDGTVVAFLSDTGSGMAIQTVSAAGTGEPTVVAEFSNEILYNLSWGEELIFGKRPKEETSANNGEIYTISDVGSGLRRLTNNEAFDGSPSVSPDGTKLALVRTTFASGKYSTAGELTLVVVNLADQTETELGSADGILGWKGAEQTGSSP